MVGLRIVDTFDTLFTSNTGIILHYTAIVHVNICLFNVLLFPSKVTNPLAAEKLKLKRLPF
jgi:hypothetical protein